MFHVCVFSVMQSCKVDERHDYSWPPSKPTSDERRAAKSSAHSSSSSSSHRSQETDFQRSSTATAVRRCVYLRAVGTAVFMWCIYTVYITYACVCVRESRHLEGHDEVSEMKLGLQVQLDGHILHTCKKKKQTQPNRKLTITVLPVVKIQNTPSALTFSQHTVRRSALIVSAAESAWSQTTPSSSSGLCSTKIIVS